MTRTVPILTFVLSLAACERSPPVPKATVEEAIVSLPAVPGRPGALYFELRTNEEAMRLTGIGSPRIGRIELHETVTENGVSRMTRLKDVRFSSDQALAFQPGGRHAMAFDIDPRIRPGDSLALTFTFDPAPPVTVEAEVRAAGDVGHAGH